MPFEATPYIFFTTDIIYMVAVLSPEMGFTLTLSVCVCVCVCVSVFMSPVHAVIHVSIHSTIYLSFHLCTQLTLPTSIHPSIHPSSHLFFYQILLSEICDHLIFVLVIKHFLPIYINPFSAVQYCFFTGW